jgi:hypothetical protein
VSGTIYAAGTPVKIQGTGAFGSSLIVNDLNVAGIGNWWCDGSHGWAKSIQPQFKSRSMTAPIDYPD